MATSKKSNLRLIESVSDEPKKLLQPISGYEKMIVKSLEDACEPIKDLFDDNLTQNITIAKTNSSQPKDGLSTDESAAIHLYTMEWSEHEHSLYMILNRTLRQADRTKLKPWFKYLKLFLTAFFKLPASENTLLWRGVREDLSALYPKDKEFAWWAVSSCTASIAVLEAPNYLGKSGARTMFSIQTNSGRDIRAHSYFAHEDEIVLPPGCYFRVIGCLNPAEGLHVIQLREVAPPFPMLAEPFDLSHVKKEYPANIPIKQENYHTPKPPPERKEQYYAAPTYHPPYFPVRLNCQGLACKRCGRCRDWFWYPSGNAKIYQKYNGSRCVGNACGFNGYAYFHRFNSYNYNNNAVFGLNFGTNLTFNNNTVMEPVCECEDNAYRS